MPSANAMRTQNTVSNSSVQGKLGTLTTRLAHNDGEVRAAQKIRYKVFCEELGAKPGIWNRVTQRDGDRHDRNCDHLLMFDEPAGQSPAIVGTQRFFVGTGNTRPEDFYSAAEFDIASLLCRHRDKTFMELGRSCILAEYRNRRTMELMWHGTWQYALRNSVDVMFGCASIYADDASRIADELAFLSNRGGSGEWAVTSNHNARISLDQFAHRDVDAKAALRKLPPLIKGYLRLGAFVSSDAVRDRNFGTIDLLVVLPVAAINARYIAHYGSKATRHGR